MWAFEAAGEPRIPAAPPDSVAVTEGAGRGRKSRLVDQVAFSGAFEVVRKLVL